MVNCHARNQYHANSFLSNGLSDTNTFQRCHKSRCISKYQQWQYRVYSTKCLLWWIQSAYEQINIRQSLSDVYCDQHTNILEMHVKFVGSTATWKQNHLGFPLAVLYSWSLAQIYSCKPSQNYQQCTNSWKISFVSCSCSEITLVGVGNCQWLWVHRTFQWAA